MLNIQALRAGVPVLQRSTLACRYFSDKASNALPARSPADRIYKTVAVEPLYDPSFQTQSAAVIEANKRRVATEVPWSKDLPRPVSTVSPAYLNLSLNSHVAPTAREAKKQIAALIQPEHMAAVGRAMGTLGRGANSATLTRLTNYRLSIGRLTRLLTSNGNTSGAERAVQNALVRLNKALQPIRAKHDTKAAAGAISFEQWYTGRQQLAVVDQFERILRLVAPYVELKSIRKAGKVYSMPVPVANESRRRSLVLRALVEVIGSHSQHGLENRILHELSLLRTFRSPLFKKVAEMYGTAYANRSFAHFR